MFFLNRRINTKIFIYFCNHQVFLDRKILTFFFHINYMSIQNFEFGKFKSFKNLKFIYIYKILFIFLKFVYFIINLINTNFKINTRKFFSNKINLVQFLIYFRFILFNIFLNKKNKFYKYLIKFTFKLYLKYLLYSIFYFLKLYLLNIRNFELKKKNVKEVVYSIPKLDKVNNSFLYYENKIFNLSNMNKLSKKKINLGEKEIPLHLFVSNRVNFKTLEDYKFSLVLNSIRKLFRSLNREENSVAILEKIIKRSIPLSKIIYQRRGRNMIPLMNFVYNSNIRNSLGFKCILSNSNTIIGLSKDSYEKKLLINLLDILVLDQNEGFVYQADKNSDVRKEAYNRGYFLKTLKFGYKNQ